MFISASLTPPVFYFGFQNTFFMSFFALFFHGFFDHLCDFSCPLAPFLFDYLLFLGELGVCGNLKHQCLLCLKFVGNLQLPAAAFFHSNLFYP